MTKVSVMTMVYGELLEKGKLTDDEMLAKIEKMGFDGVELFADRILSQPGLLKTHISYLDNSKLKVTCMDAGCNFIAPDKKGRDAGVAAPRAAIDIAPSLGCPLILAAGSNISGDITPADGRKMIADGLNACIPEARELRVTIAIENFGVAPTLQCKAVDCLEILNAVPGLAFVFDTGNFYFCGEDPLNSFDALATKTIYVHLKDWVKSDKPDIADVAGAALGAGIIPNEKLLRKFQQKGRVDSFSIELGAPGDRFEATRKDLETVRRWISSEGAKP
jgi:sugar phosphate isomerase/epimerase